MPSSATITTFYTFTANTKARASQANANFSNFRGHSLPIEPLTATASDQTYDLGSDEHRWRTGYVQSVDFATSTNTSTLVLKGNTSNTTGAFLFQIEGSTKAEVNASGVNGAYMQTATVSYWALAVVPQMNYQAFAASGSWTCPSGVTYAVVVGCGGGGGGGASTGGDGGGGQGAPKGLHIVGVTPGNVYTVTIGTAGAGSTGTGGGNGGTTSFGSVNFQGGYAGADSGGTSGAGGSKMAGGAKGGSGAVDDAQSSFASAAGTYSGKGGAGGAGPYGSGGNGGNNSHGGAAAANSGGGGGGGGNGSYNGGAGGTGYLEIFWVKNQ